MSTISVTRSNYPTIHEAFETISHDGGGRAGWQVYLVPIDWGGRLHAIEGNLSLLSPDDLETFCIGEQDEMLELMAAHKLDTASELISAFLEFNWERQQ